jgi:hypothetical protein
LGRRSRTRPARRQDRPLPPARHHESGEEFGAIIVAEEMHHRLRHGGIVGDDGLDFAQFDAEAADLHLRIDAADEFDVAHRVQTHQIARTIDQSRSAVGPIKRRLHEFLGGQVRAADIARPTPGPPMTSSPSAPAGTGHSFSSTIHAV